MIKNGTIKLPPGFNCIETPEGTDFWCCPVRTANAIIGERDVKIDSYALLRILDNCKSCRYAAHEMNEEE